jgi:hypothetical protein
MRRTDDVEQPYVLSPDGHTLVLGDEYGLVLVDITTATSRRVPLEARNVVLHWWAPDGSQLVFTPRGSGEKTLALVLEDLAVRRVDYRAWASSVGPQGQIAEFLPRATSREPIYTEVQIHQATGGATPPVTLGVQVRPRPTIGRQWGSLIPVLQIPRGRGVTVPARGVLALDPRTGQGVGLLELGGGKAGWTSMPAVTSDGWILLNVAHGEGGGLVAWDPVHRRLRAVMAFDEQATHVSVAAEAFESSAAAARP